MELVGEFLKKNRIKRKISLLSISKKLKISIGFLEAIENNDFSKTPGGAYTIGYIRLYSNFLNLDSNEIINQYKIQISFSESDKSIKLKKPISAFQPFLSFRLSSFAAVAFIFVAFYFLFVDDLYISPKYAMTPDIPEKMIPQLEQFEVENTLSVIKKKMDEDTIVQNNNSEIQLLNKQKNLILNNNQINAIASLPTDKASEEIKKLISIKALQPTWIQLRNQEDEIIYSKLMVKNEEYNYSFLDNYTLTTGNAGNLIILINGKVMGKLGKKGEVLDSIVISSDYFLN